MTTAGQLTEAHRQLQVRIGAQTVRQLVAAFPLLDPTDIDGTTEQWLRVVTPVIQQQRRLSATAAGVYLEQLRAKKAGGYFTPVLADIGDPAAIATSLVVTGPVSIKMATRAGTPIARAVAIAMAASSAAGMRHVLNGGRETVTRTAAADRRVVGVIRVTSGNACSFCESLAGEHGVHADFQAHDGCTCTAELAYS